MTWDILELTELSIFIDGKRFSYCCISFVTHMKIRWNSEIETAPQGCFYPRSSHDNAHQYLIKTSEIFALSCGLRNEKFLLCFPRYWRRQPLGKSLRWFHPLIDRTPKQDCITECNECQFHSILRPIFCL
jgi:hypothetical protein